MDGNVLNAKAAEFVVPQRMMKNFSSVIAVIEDIIVIALLHPSKNHQKMIGRVKHV